MHLQYKYCISVPDAEVTAYIGRWRVSSVSAEAAAFARDVITAAGPGGQERAKNLLWAAGRLADYAALAGPGADTGDGVAPVGDRTVRAFRAGAVAGSAPDAAHQSAVHRPPGGPAAVSGRCAAAAGTGQGPVQPGGDRRLPGTGGRAARHRAADAGCRADLPGRGRRGEHPRRPARCPRQGRDRPIRRAGGSRPRLPPADGAGAGALSRAAAGRSALRRASWSAAGPIPAGGT